MTPGYRSVRRSRRLGRRGGRGVCRVGQQRHEPPFESRLPGPLVALLGARERGRLLPRLGDARTERLGLGGVGQVHLDPRLPESRKERHILQMYYLEGLTLREIGAMLSITESRVCQIHSNVIKRLRQRLDKDSAQFKI